MFPLLKMNTFFRVILSTIEKVHQDFRPMTNGSPLNWGSCDLVREEWLTKQEDQIE